MRTFPGLDSAAPVENILDYIDERGNLNIPESVIEQHVENNYPGWIKVRFPDGIERTVVHGDVFISFMYLSIFDGQLLIRDDARLMHYSKGSFTAEQCFRYGPRTKDMYIREFEELNKPPDKDGSKNDKEVDVANIPDILS